MQLTQGPGAAQQQPDLAGQLDGGLVHGHQQGVGEQPADRRPGVCCPECIPHLTVGGAACQGVEHLAGVRAGAGHQCREPIPVGEQRRDAAQSFTFRQAQRLEQWGYVPGAVAPQAHRDRAPQAGRRRREDVTHSPRHPHEVRRPVDQRQLAQPVQRRLHLRGRRRVAHQGQQVAVGGAALQQHQGIEYGEVEAVQQVERPQHRQPDAGARREHPDIRRHRGGQIRSGLEQRRQPLVGPAPQLVSQATTGHRVQVNGPGHRGQVSIHNEHSGERPNQSSQPPDPHGLVTGEGVDEGSADSAGEGPPDTVSSTGPASTGPGSAGPGASGPGASGPGAMASVSDPAPPLDMESAESRKAREQTGSGQQLAEGEG